ncbi:glucuronyl hydrolase [Hahella sp. KA22]|uniref:glucuronyl hydrolase n=1 Tax=Hahella sp. KA22 TaxID=1628392 RepID=UPI000FDDE814|nr:glucuronyl hydrolase [Hahella sp. KA22]AZZ92915.1 glucuronyl hydrolase [Hahella sp. KA22]QAY56289.1 glucuronyl hydrolase [Hahella sp. KA22]
MSELQSPRWDAAALSQQEITKAIGLLMRRLDVIDAQCGAGFPLFSPDGARWKVSSGGSWMGGFWAGCWGLRALVSKSADDRDKALALCSALSDKLQADTLNRSMIFWYGPALCGRWFHDPEAQRLASQAAAAVVSSFDSELGYIPLGCDMGGGADGRQRLSVDALAATIQLLQVNDDEALDKVARAHTDALIAACFTASGACSAEAQSTQQQEPQQSILQALDRPGGWSRGQAWAMLGLSHAAIRWGSPYLDYARAACVYWRRSRRTPFPADRPERSDSLSDPSAALIAAVAILTLSERLEDGDRWRTYAAQQIAALVRSSYFVRRDSGIAPLAGAFKGACYRTSPAGCELVESPWSSFFLLEALCMLAGLIDGKEQGTQSHSMNQADD